MQEQELEVNMTAEEMKALQGGNKDDPLYQSAVKALNEVTKAYQQANPPVDKSDEIRARQKELREELGSGGRERKTRGVSAAGHECAACGAAAAGGGGSNGGSTTKAGMKQCSKCTAVYYCDRACQRKHWKVHKKTCTKKAQPGGGGGSGGAAGGGAAGGGATGATVGGHSYDEKYRQFLLQQGHSPKLAELQSRIKEENQKEVEGVIGDGIAPSTSGAKPAYSSQAELKKHYRDAKKNQTKMVYMPFFDMPSPSGPAAACTRPELHERLLVLKEAHDKFYMHTANTRFERAYRTLYDDIRTHHVAWFGLFEGDNNHVYAERCVGILGTLATIYRQRGEVSEAAEVLALDERVLLRYRDMASRSLEDLPYQNCMRCLVYKFNMIKMNINMQTGRVRSDESAELFRDLCRYELEEKYDFEAQNFLFIIGMVVGGSEKKRMEFYMGLTVAQLNALPNSDMVRCMLASMKSSGIDTDQENCATEWGNGEGEEGGLDVAKKHCGNCNKQEPMLGDFDVCSRCKIVTYCSVECQSKHWKAGHKKACGDMSKAAKTAKKTAKKAKKAAETAAKQESKAIEQAVGYVETLRKKNAEQEKAEAEGKGNGCNEGMNEGASEGRPAWWSLSPLPSSWSSPPLMREVYDDLGLAEVALAIADADDDKLRRFWVPRVGEEAFTKKLIPGGEERYANRLKDRMLILNNTFFTGLKH